MAVGVVLKILTSKWTYISLALLALVIFISVLFIKLNLSKSEIKKLERDIIDLKTTNEVLVKDNAFKAEQLELTSKFSNSTIYIERIVTNYVLSTEEKLVVDAISNDFYKSFGENK